MIVNFTPEIRHGYKVRVPIKGTWREVLNTDAAMYGGSNVGNGGAVPTIEDGEKLELELTLPPLVALFFVPE